MNAVIEFDIKAAQRWKLFHCTQRSIGVTNCTHLAVAIGKLLYMT
jgi:hypothetical protein